MKRNTRSGDSNKIIMLLSSSEDESIQAKDPTKQIKQHKPVGQKKTTVSFGKGEPNGAMLGSSININSWFLKNKPQSQQKKKAVVLDDFNMSDVLTESSSSESEHELSGQIFVNKLDRKKSATSKSRRILLTKERQKKSNNVLYADSIEALSGSDNDHDNNKNSSNRFNDESDDDNLIQVPDSSPQRNPRAKFSSGLDSSPTSKITTKLPNLTDFAWKDDNKFSQNNYTELRKMFPKLASNVIISTLRKQRTMRNAMRFLKTLPNSGYSLTPRSASRLESLHTGREKLRISLSPMISSSEILTGESLVTLRLDRRKMQIEEKKKQQKLLQKEREDARKKADEEKIISYKVQLDDTKKSLRERYINDRLSKRKTILDDEEMTESSGDDSVIELINNSDEELIPSKKSKRTKRRYEEDNDYNDSHMAPTKKKRSKATRFARAERRAVAIEDEDFQLPAFEADEYADLNINEKIIKLFNNAEVRDIFDLSNMKPEQVQIIIENRPYNSIKDIKKVDINPGKTRRSNVKTAIEKHLEITAQKLSAYTAIDTLLKQCFDYSRWITSEIKKWGINLRGKNLGGEVAITEVNVSSVEESSEEEEVERDDVSESFDDEPVVKRKYKKFKIDGSENDDDFVLGRDKKLAASNIDNSKVVDKPGYFKKKPALLSDEITLKDYQQVGINWIYLLFRKQLSCILADEMGLGKTAQVIAFLSHLKKKKYKGPHLIVVPSSTLENWLREFEKFSPSMKVIPYYGSVDEREEIRSVLYEENDYDVVVTTYNLTTGKLDSPFLQSLNFNVIVYDEGHMLKNAGSDRYKKLTKLKANFRMLLTGTPLQNNLKELISLLNFILPEVFDSKMKKLELLFDQRASTKTDEQKIEGENYNPLMSEQAISKAKVMMTPFVLRRTKAQVMKDLPQKHTTIEYCELNKAQLRIYDEELKMAEEYRKEKARFALLHKNEQQNLAPVERKSLNTLMTLRKACMHPLLFRRLYSDKMLRVMAKLIMKNPEYHDANEQYIFEDMQVMSDFELSQLCHSFPNELGKFVLKQNVYQESGKTQKLVEMLAKKIAKGEKILVFSLFTQMLDILEKVLSIHNWKFLRLDGATQVDTRQSIIDKFYEDKTIPIMLLSTKAGGFGINLICATNVIIYDQSLNPHDDKQAEDRAHRVGQTKEVYVTRLITKSTIEENILHMAFNKLQLDNSMMAQNAEDVLLKTVEDLIVAKNSEPKQIVEVKQDDEKERSAFEAFESPILELAVDEDGDEPIEVNANSVRHETTDLGKRTRRRRQNVSYVDDDRVPRDWLNDGDDQYESKNIKKRNSHSIPENEQSDKNNASMSSVKFYDPEDDASGNIITSESNWTILDAVTRAQIAIKSIESNKPVVDAFITGSQHLEKVKSIDEYLKDINKAPKGIENDPGKRMQYHNQAAEKILLLQEHMKRRILHQIDQTIQHTAEKPEQSEICAIGPPDLVNEDKSEAAFQNQVQSISENNKTKQPVTESKSESRPEIRSICDILNADI